MVEGRRGRIAFTVLELLLAVGLLSLITFALYSMFSQTQKALHANITQTDVDEGGRAAMELISKELEQMTATTSFTATNFAATPTPFTPVLQELFMTNVFHTNVLQDVFFMMRFNKKVTGVGYRVVGASNGVGTLTRFEVSTNLSLLTPYNLYQPFLNAEGTNLQRVTDGVVHLNMRTFDLLGNPSTNSLPRLSLYTNYYGGIPVRGLSFSGDRLPAYVDFELGVLEPPTLVQFRSIQQKAAAAAFLRTHANKVHIYRQRIPIHSAFN